MSETPDASLTGDEELLKEMRERYDEAIEYWSPIWAQGDQDMRSLSVEGDWDPEARKDRDVAKRPVTHTDIISQFNNRLVNQARMRKRGFKFVSSGPNATDDTARMREDRARQIQYESKAFTARLTALQNSVDRGMGHWKISTERINPRSFDQRIIIERIPNVKSVVIDPKTRKSDRSDQRYAWHIDKVYTEKEFIAEFPEAKVQSFDPQKNMSTQKWIGTNYILVAQYYRVIKKKTKLLLIEGEDKPILETDLPEGAKVKGKTVVSGDQVFAIKRSETTEISTVEIRLTNGIEFLGEPTPWMGTTIPILTCVGREKYIDNKLDLESLTRKMREPQREYDFANSAEVEDVGMSPKPKWLVELGQVEDLPEWEEANRSNFPYLRWRGQIEGREAHQPLRVDSAVDMTKYELVKSSALRAAQNAVGMTTADAIDRQSKSGVAQDKLDQNTDINGFHFTDNWDDAIEYEGRIINEIMDKIEDTQRVVGLRDKDDSFSTQQLDVQQGPDGEVQNHPYGASEDHGVTVEVGPDSSSQREEAKDFLSKFMDSLKGSPLYDRVAYLMLQFQNLGPVMDQAVDNLTPADIKQAQEAEKNGQPPIPPQVQQAMQSMQMHVQQMQALLKEQAQVIDSKQIEAASRKDIELGKADFQTKLAMFNKFYDFKIAALKVNAQAASDAAYIENDQKIAAEEHSLDFDLSQIDNQQQTQLAQMSQQHEAGMAAMGQQGDAAMQGADQAHEAGMQGADQAHEANMTAVNQQHEVGMTKMNQKHETGLTASGQKHESKMATQAQKATAEQIKLKPKPTAGKK